MIKIGKDNKNYYPTPNEIVNKMICNIDWNTISTILEPSAGSGNIVDNILYTTSYRSKKLDIDCIEIDEQLQIILKGKGHRIIHNNFLTFNTMKKYDLIIMNPPFENGAKHLIKALEMQKNGGSVICLLNAETLKNKFSNERKDLSNMLEDMNANIEYIENAFLTAERKTSVEIALIKVCIPVEKNVVDVDIFEKFKKPTVLIGEEETEQEHMLTKYTEENDYIDLIVEQFETETRMGMHLIEEYNKMKPYFLKNVYKDKKQKYSEYEYSLSLIICDKDNEDYRYSQYDCSSNLFLEVMRKKYWNALFHSEKFVNKLTDNLRESLNSKLDTYVKYDFNIFNIYTLMQEINLQTVKGIEDTIMNLFYEFSGKHAYNTELNNKNIHYYNGWCTNKSWKINNKVIVPYLRSNWEGKDRINDIHKTLSYLDGNISEVDVWAEIKKQWVKKNGCDYPNSTDYYIPDVKLPYFSVHFYKKGTAHILFTNEELLDKFNLFACKNKNEIPHFYGRKSYKDMNEKEKELVKEFSGSEEKYNDIYNNQDKYLMDFKKQLLLN